VGERGRHLDFVGNLGMDIAVAAVDSIGTDCCAAVDSSYLLFLLQILSLCFFHHGHGQP
jgi:hypothetical protein